MQQASGITPVLLVVPEVPVQLESAQLAVAIWHIILYTTINQTGWLLDRD
jgi:hypothetical protein